MRAYAVTATAARTGDESVAAGLALAASASGAGTATAGVLIACTSAVHAVAGPLIGTRLDSSPARRAVIVLAPIYFATLIGLVFVLLDTAPLPVLAVACVAGGFSGPVLLGGLSATLVDLVPADPPSGRARALRIDAITYNVAAIGAPLLAAATVVWIGASWMAALLAACGVIAALAASRLPIIPSVRPEQVSGFDAVATLWRRRPLRAATLATTFAFVGVGGIPLALVGRGDELGREGMVGVALAAAAGAGLLASGLPLAPARANRRVVVTLGIAAAGLTLASVAPSAVLIVVAMAITGGADGALLPAVLMVRSEHTDEGTRGAVFTTAASLKIAAGAAGAAITGIALDVVSAQAVLATIAAIHAIGAALATSGARHGGRRAWHQMSS